MAASYSTGSASGPIDLLQKLVTWLVAQGWTSDSSVTYGAGWRAHLHKGGQYVNLRAFVNEAMNIATGLGSGSGSTTAGYGVAMYLGDGYNGSNAWNAQSGGPLDNTATYRVCVGLYLTAAAIPTYHFLDDGNSNITVVVDKGSGLTGHLGWGPSLVKTGYTSDSWYFFGSSPGYMALAPSISPPMFGVEAPAQAPLTMSYYDTGANHGACGFVRVDASVFSARWLSLTDNTNQAQRSGYTGRQAWPWHIPANPQNTGLMPIVAAVLAQRSWQTAFVGALLLPVHVFMQGTTGRWVPLGCAPTAFIFGGVGHGFSSGTVVAIGGVNYLVFANFAIKKLA